MRSGHLNAQEILSHLQEDGHYKRYRLATLKDINPNNKMIMIGISTAGEIQTGNILEIQLSSRQNYKGFPANTIFYYVVGPRSWEDLCTATIDEITWRNIRAKKRTTYLFIVKK